MDSSKKVQQSYGVVTVFWDIRYPSQLYEHSPQIKNVDLLRLRVLRNLKMSVTIYKLTYVLEPGHLNGKEEK